jgi:hypothetical protein
VHLYAATISKVMPPPVQRIPPPISKVSENIIRAAGVLGKIEVFQMYGPRECKGKVWDEGESA